MNKRLLFSALVLFCSITIYAQCPTNIADPDGDGGRYFLTLSSLAQCSTAPYDNAGTVVTLNGSANEYVTGYCGNYGNASGPVIAEITFSANAGTPVILASSSTVTLVAGSSTCIYNTSGVLPVELVAFTGKHTEGGNRLTWQTSSEQNNKGFQVERLMDNGEWLMLGFVAAKGKAGSYEFTDNTPLSISSYRLRQIDNDGSATFSKTITIQRTDKRMFLAVYPNPVSNLLTIETGASNFDYHIINLLGQVILRGVAQTQIDVSALPKGTYVLKMGTEQAKFIKQ
jgi:hypothetical protein